MTTLDVITPITWKTRLAAKLQTSWLPLVLCIMLLIVASSSLTAARWINEAPRYIDALWLGAAFGAALAGSRFRALTALAYSGMLGLAVTAEIVGRVLPTWPQLQNNTWPDVLWGMHIRALILIDQINHWATAIVFGGTVQDNGFFIALVALLLWSVSVWLMWALIRRRQALAGLAPLTILVAFNNTLANRSATEYALFLAPVLLLLGYYAYRRAETDWDQRQVGYAEFIGMDWMINAAVATTLIMVLVVTSPWLGTPSGWRVLGDLFRIAQSQSAETAERLFGDVNPPRPPGSNITARVPNLSLLSNPVPQGDEVVMWVKLSDPEPLPPEVPNTGNQPPTHYWRSQVYGTYSGQGWEPIAADTAPQSTVATIPLGRYTLQQQFEIVAAHGPELFAVNVPITASAEANIVHLPFEADAVLRGETSIYTATSWATQRTASALISAPADYPAEVRATYLQLPNTLPERVRDLARRIIGDAATPLEKAMRVQTYLRLNYPYQLEVPPRTSGQDAVDYFLFEAPGGNCNYYASAMAVLLRTLNVPARVAVGYAMGTFDFERRAYRVTADSAHAWVEVYFPGVGWVEFEPTSNRSALNYIHAQPDVSDPVVTQIPNASQSNSYVFAFIVLGLLVLAWVLWQLRQRPRGERVAELYWRVRGALAWAGWRGSATTTPDEFFASLTPALTQRKNLSSALAQATALHERALYGAHPISLAEANHVERLWRKARWEWLAAWARELTARFKGK